MTFDNKKGGSTAYCTSWGESGIGIFHKINICYINNLPIDSPPNHNTAVVAKADSGASNHYWRQQDVTCLTDISHNSSINVQLPNAQSILSTKQGQLNLHPSLSTQSQ